ncbi:MAG: hypothetical protein R3E66_05765 [bacterium]
MRLLVFALIVCLGGSAWAQDENAESRSRNVAKEKATKLGGDYHASVFGGSYVQGERFGVLFDLGAKAGADFGVHDVYAKFDYTFDPFSTKSFNFPDENQTTAGAAVTDRLAQSMHEVQGEVGWQARWSKENRSSASLTGGVRLPEFDTDRRYAADLEFKHRWGRRKGWVVEGDIDVFLRDYPNYFIADRRFDNRGFSVAPAVIYVFDGGHAIQGTYDYEFTQYVDARYDTIAVNGVVSRATESKSYAVHAFDVEGTYRFSKRLKARAQYQFELNDSINYDREMAGIDANGVREDKFIRDYYDYTRHRLKLRGGYDNDTFAIDGSLEYWVRDFDTYEARDAQNVWTGFLRHDNSVEIGVEASYLVLEPQENELRVVGFMSHLHRDSNMKREISFATNYDVTRVFVGLELRSK